MLRQIHRYIWLSNWFMGRGLKKRNDGQNSVDFNIDYRFLFSGNLVFSFVLTRKEMRNSFNLLLVALAFFDSCYLIGAQLESIR